MTKHIKQKRKLERRKRQYETTQNKGRTKQPGSNKK